MTYYNPRIYNYSNLHDEDKREFKMIMYFINSIDNIIADYEVEEETLIEKAVNEIKLVTLNEVKERLEHELVEYIVSVMDNYDGDVKEIETDDYFYGYKRGE